MAYECQNFKDGQVLTAECLNKIEKALEAICNKEITSAHLNNNSELVFVFCNGAELNTGVVIGRAESDKVFIATYGVTTTAEVINAYNNGQRIICHYTTEQSGHVYAELVSYASEIFHFVDLSPESGAARANFILDEADGWEYYETDYAAGTHTHAISEVIGLETRLSIAERTAAGNEIAIENLFEGAETWTFTLDDGTTVTKKVVLA